MCAAQSACTSAATFAAAMVRLNQHTTVRFRFGPSATGTASHEPGTSECSVTYVATEHCNMLCNSAKWLPQCTRACCNVASREPQNSTREHHQLSVAATSMRSAKGAQPFGEARWDGQTTRAVRCSSSAALHASRVEQTCSVGAEQLAVHRSLRNGCAPSAYAASYTHALRKHSSGHSARTRPTPCQTCNRQRATASVQQATDSVQQATDSVQQATDSVQQATDSVQQPTDSVHQPTDTMPNRQHAAWDQGRAALHAAHRTRVRPNGLRCRADRMCA